jgi:hypothetical protein
MTQRHSGRGRQGGWGSKTKSQSALTKGWVRQQHGDKSATSGYVQELRVSWVGECHGWGFWAAQGRQRHNAALPGASWSVQIQTACTISLAALLFAAVLLLI